MSIKTFKPTTPSRRQMTVSGFDGIDKKAKPEPSLTEPLKKSSGRNSYGRITVRHRGGGNKRKYRIIDFKRDKLDVPGKEKRMGAGRPGMTKTWKKAYVQLTADSKTIEFFEGMV